MIARSQQLIPVNYIEQFQSKNKNKNETTKIISNWILFSQTFLGIL